jgi:hypothetical protein
MSTVYVDLIFVPEPAVRKLIPARKRHQGWMWVARNADNQKRLARSSERYTNRSDALAAVEQLFGAATTVFKREAEQGNVLLRQGE